MLQAITAISKTTPPVIRKTRGSLASLLDFFDFPFAVISPCSQFPQQLVCAYLHTRSLCLDFCTGLAPSRVTQMKCNLTFSQDSCAHSERWTERFLFVSIGVNSWFRLNGLALS